MRKSFYLSGLFLCILALCVCGCGGGSEGSAADPMGTATVRFIDEGGAIITTTTVAPNGTITLRAWVTNTRSSGTVVPVVNEKVSFVIVNSGNGGSLVASSDHTGSDGQVTALFTSGNSMYSDNVRVTTSVGATATIYINKVSGSPDPYIKEMKSSNTEVVAGQTSVITVNVVDGTGSAVKNVYIRFRLAVNNSGAVFADAYADANFYAYTDLGGNATVVYQAGNGNPYSIVYDSVVAETENGSSMAVEIKRTAGTVPEPPEELSVTLAAAPTSVAAGITSIITATVAGTDKAGADVTFTIPVNNSGATFIVNGISQPTANIKTGGNGIATIIYRAGSGSSDTVVQDTIQAALTNEANAAIILTRTATTPSTPSTYTVALAASSTSVKAGEVSIITATVTTTTGGTSTAAGGVTVNFTLPVQSSSGPSLSAATATTDGSGKAVVIYRPGATQVTVQDTVRAAVGTAASAVAITVNGSSTMGYSITLEAAPQTLTADNANSIITANVKNNAGAVISGVTVHFDVTSGDGRVSPMTATTDNSGNAVTTFTGAGDATADPPITLPAGTTAVVTASIMSGTYTDAVIITYP